MNIKTQNTCKKITKNVVVLFLGNIKLPTIISFVFLSMKFPKFLELIFKILDDPCY